MIKFFCRLALLVLVLAACTEKERHYVIGISQCSDDIWREKQNAELRMGAYFNEGVELRFAAAYDSDERQVQQIDSLVATGIDLLIVAPNQVQTISPAIDRAFDKGIPVIVFERKTNSKKYTAYMGADNYEMGRVMGEYIAARMDGRGRVVEVMGLMGSSPAQERHKGFADALSRCPGIQLVATLQGDWTEESGFDAVMKYQGTLSDIDYVFAQNDRMAIGARRAFQTSRLSPFATKFCGIDALPGDGGGIQLVRDSVLDASYIYPTHGDRLLQQAVNILDGKSYDKEVLLMSALVTRDNASVLLMQSEEIVRQSTYLDQLHKRADTYLQQLDLHRTILLLAFGVIVLLLIAITLFYLYNRGKITLRSQRVVSNLWNMEEQPASAQASSISSGEEQGVESLGVRDSDTDVDKSLQTLEGERGGQFITRLKEVVEAHLSDSDFSVEDMAAKMNLSRVQLYRKVKSITNSSPVELLRTARLNRGYQMLMTTDKTISEVAYAVGFSAPSYFTKCFKDEFGMSPGDVRQ